MIPDRSVLNVIPQVGDSRCFLTSLKFCRVILTVFQYFLVKASVVHLGEGGGGGHSPPLGDSWSTMHC